jgi:Mrp family chromosome partitioning ATPase
VYDFVVIDTPPALTEHVLTAFDLSPDPPALIFGLGADVLGG